MSDKGRCGMKECATQDSVLPHRVITVPARSSPALAPSDVITGLVPVIPIVWSAAPLIIGMAGTRQAKTQPVAPGGPLHFRRRVGMSPGRVGAAKPAMIKAWAIRIERPVPAGLPGQRGDP